MSDLKSSQVTVIERPVSKARWPKEKVLATARSRKAIRFPMNGIEEGSLRASIAQTAMRLGLRARTRRDGDYMIAWCEPRDRKKTAP